MDGVFEKFSVYDFFNLIFCGGTFMLGLHIIEFTPILYLKDKIGMPQNDFIFLGVVLLVCYIIGFELQAIESIIMQKIFKIQSKMTGSFLLDENDIISNHLKKKVYQQKAKELFKAKNIEVKNNKFSVEQCEYFFAYCSYFNQVNGQSKKTEKMRGLKGISGLWMICFTSLFLIGGIRLLYLIPIYKSFKESFPLLFIIGIFGVLAATSYNRMKTNIKYWIRMVLGVYEVCRDIGTTLE